MLYIMRHGKTDWNAVRKLQGRTDVPLNEEGREMARAAAKEYADVHFDVCYCSPLSRTRETAAILLEGRDVPIIVDDRLIEMSFGIHEGIEDSFSVPDCPINILFTEPENYTPVEGGGETIEELYARTGEFLRECVDPRLARGEDVLIIGHGAMNSSIVCQRKHLPVSNFLNTGFGQCKLLELP